MKYVIHKTSKSPRATSYCGPTWDETKLRDCYQSTYKNFQDVVLIADLLAIRNPVGFSVSDENGVCVYSTSSGVK